MKLLLIAKRGRGGKCEWVYENGFWSLKETTLWPRKMEKNLGDGEPGAGADALGCGWGSSMMKR
jgi:hypothetical protein